MSHAQAVSSFILCRLNFEFVKRKSSVNREPKAMTFECPFVSILLRVIEEAEQECWSEATRESFSKKNSFCQPASCLALTYTAQFFPLTSMKHRSQCRKGLPCRRPTGGQARVSFKRLDLVLLMSEFTRAKHSSRHVCVTRQSASEQT
jgi:hypothetical protein